MDIHVSTAESPPPLTERGILFSATMIRAILANQKRITRRSVNKKTLRVLLDHSITNEGEAFGMPVITAPKGIHQARMNPHGAVTLSKLNFGVKPGEFHFRCPYVDGITRLTDFSAAKGRRKCWTIRPFANQRLWVRETWRGEAGAVQYRADDDVDGGRWRPAIHMPRKLSRLTLAVEEVRIERLHDINDDDARSEGVANRAAFEALWKDINGTQSWSENPFVWVVTFARTT